jgi:hypothetical protein
MSDSLPAHSFLPHIQNGETPRQVPARRLSDVGQVAEWFCAEACNPGDAGSIPVLASRDGSANSRRGRPNFFHSE